MSATNRGGQRSDADDYPTPPWSVHRLLEKLKLPAGDWLEPGAGEGNIIRAVNEVRQDVTWWAVENRTSTLALLQELCGERALIHDFLDPNFLQVPEPKYEVAIGNPPYRLAMEFVLRSLQLANTVAMLLRLNFLGSEERHEWMKKYPPDLYILPNRPSFRGQGSDSIEYAWFVWEDGLQERAFGIHRVLDLTPLEVRQEQKPANLGPVPKKLTKKGLARRMETLLADLVGKELTPEMKDEMVKRMLQELNGTDGSVP